MPAEARYYEIHDNKIRCLLCPHHCVVGEGETGICGARTNSNQRLYTKIYGGVSSIAMDPIEKKPLYHFYPGSFVLSVGTIGCNLKCPYCQNWNISQNNSAKTSFLEPAGLVRAAKAQDSIGIAYTYSEPCIWAEYLLDAGAIARQKGLKNILVTNGFINQAPLRDILTITDAMNIDLKTFNSDTFRKIHKGRLEDVIKTIEITHSAGCHIELTTLIVPGINDTIEEMRKIIAFIKSIDESIPWHISRYFPAWKYDAAPTDTNFMLRVYEEAAEILPYVYCGNMRGGRVNDTYCPSCGTLLIQRSGFSAEIKSVKSPGVCAKCGFKLNIVMQQIISI
ncbi:MAG: AmmeMemoRadiSam system radical SAM enzyme [Spirochaetia bacterium]|jgi:pyruvate formate lyase activating enzyme|nr:AmmeMemoRadiSam system radical SAM enzyme [Spirochaetia bacterium]